jgi:MoaA/NifB/PqqE/SkfB family radical SAM enzyme
MNVKFFTKLAYTNFLFWLSHKIDRPLLPPDMVQVNFTFRCNLSCKMCSMNSQMKILQAQGKPTEINSDVFKSIISQTKQLGTKCILFIGGEPLLRKDLFELVSYAKGKELNTVIVTNGVLLDEKAILKCFESGVDWLSISIDAADEQSFQAIRGAGVLDKIKQNIRLLNKLKKQHNRAAPNIVSVCTIMNDNIGQVTDIIELCRSLGISRIIFQPVVFNNADQSIRQQGQSVYIPEHRFGILDKAIDGLIFFKKQSRQNYNYIANSIKQLEQIRHYLKGNMHNKKLPCYAGYNRLQITQDHVIYFCIPPTKGISSSFGDVAKDSLKDLWHSKQARIRRKLIKKCKDPCLQWCSFRDDFTAFSDAINQLILFGRR